MLRSKIFLPKVILTLLILWTCTFAQIATASINGQILCETLGTFAHDLVAQDITGPHPALEHLSPGHQHPNPLPPGYSAQHPLPRACPTRAPQRSYNPMPHLEGLDRAADPHAPRFVDPLRPNASTPDPSSDCRLSRGVEELWGIVQNCFLVPLRLVLPTQSQLTRPEIRSLITQLAVRHPHRAAEFELLLQALDRWDDCQHRTPTGSRRPYVRPLSRQERLRNRFNDWVERLFGVRRPAQLPGAFASGLTCSSEQVAWQAYQTADQVRTQQTSIILAIDRDQRVVQQALDTDRENIVQLSDAASALPVAGATLTAALIVGGTRSPTLARAGFAGALRTGTLILNSSARATARWITTDAALASGLLWSSATQAQTHSVVTRIPIAPTTRTILTQQGVRSLQDASVLLESGSACRFSRVEFCGYWAQADQDLASPRSIELMPPRLSTALEQATQRRIDATRAAFCRPQ